MDLFHSICVERLKKKKVSMDWVQGMEWRNIMLCCLPQCFILTPLYLCQSQKCVNPTLSGFKYQHRILIISRLNSALWDCNTHLGALRSSPFLSNLFLAAGRPSWPGCHCVPCQSTVDGEGQEEGTECRRLRGGGGPHQTGEMNLCWNEIKRKSHNIR